MTLHESPGAGLARMRVVAPGAAELLAAAHVTCAVDVQQLARVDLAAVLADKLEHAVVTTVEIGTKFTLHHKLRKILNQILRLILKLPQAVIGLGSSVQLQMTL